MSNHRAFALLALATAAACSDTTGPGTRTFRAPSDGVLSATIVGPRIAAAPGLYVWTADVRGADEDVFYEWTVEGAGQPFLFPGSTDATLTLDLDVPMMGAIEIELVVRSGDRIFSTSERVQVCPQRQPVEWCFPEYVLDRH